MNEHDLAAIEQAVEAARRGDLLIPAEQNIVRTDVPALIAALRAAWAERDAWQSVVQSQANPLPDGWRSADALDAEITDLQAERDEFRASFLELFETTRRYRAALGHYADEENWTAPPGHAWDDLDKGYYLAPGPGYGVARAALAAPPDASAGASS